MLVLCHEFAECGPNSTVAQMNTLVRCTCGAIVDLEFRPESQTVCRTRFPDAGQQDGSHLPGQASLQVSLGDLQNRRRESGMGCWSGA
jgi:hypothetical protein